MRIHNFMLFRSIDRSSWRAVPDVRFRVVYADSFFFCSVVWFCAYFRRHGRLIPMNTIAIGNSVHQNLFCMCLLFQNSIWRLFNSEQWTILKQKYRLLIKTPARKRKNTRSKKNCQWITIITYRYTLLKKDISEFDKVWTSFENICYCAPCQSTCIYLFIFS